MLKKIYYWFFKKTSRPEEREKYSSGYWQDEVRKQTLILCKGIRGRVLEVGCGEGLFLTRLAKQNPDMEIWGIDNDNLRLERAEKKIRDGNLNNVHLYNQDASHITFEDEYFDAVICINVFFNLESFRIVKDVLNEMARICKKGGRVIFDIRNKMNPFLYFKYRFAKFYDGTIKGLPLKTYNLGETISYLEGQNFKITNKVKVGFPKNRFAPIFILEGKKK